jgi:RNAse (barnase) inhibitor barstar
MAVFSAKEENEQRLDWSILQNGGVALYWSAEIFTDDLSWFQSNGYHVVQFDAAEWLSEERMHQSLKSDLSFPDYYGMNPNALHDCMSEDLVVPETGGLVLALNHYDKFAALFSGQAEIVLDIFARAVQYHMLFGKRLLILVQSDDPKIHFGPLGGITAMWNWREWLNKNRGL